MRLECNPLLLNPQLPQYVRCERCAATIPAHLHSPTLHNAEESGSGATQLDFSFAQGAKPLNQFGNGERKSFRRGLKEGLHRCLDVCQMGPISAKDNDTMLMQLYGQNISEACIESSNISVPLRGFNYILRNTTLPTPPPPPPPICCESTSGTLTLRSP